MTDTDHSGTELDAIRERHEQSGLPVELFHGGAGPGICAEANAAHADRSWLLSRLSAIRKETIERAAKVADAKVAYFKKLYVDQADEDWGEIASAYHSSLDIADGIRALAGGRDV